MAPLTSRLSAARCIRNPSKVTTPSLIRPTTIVGGRNFSATSTKLSGDSHDSQYDPPGGWLWGVPPGQKRENEGWEWPWYIGIFGSVAFVTIGWIYKPDTSIQTWALEEARRRLEAEGTIPDPYPNHVPKKDE